MKTPHHFLGFVNVLAVDDDGWALIPYGDSGHDGKRSDLPAAEAAKTGERRTIQRFTRANADEMVSFFSEGLGRIKRAFVGLPVFKGHPDSPRFANIWRDKSPRGMITDMQARPAGLALKVVLTDQGADEVESGHKEFSPNWAGRFIEDTPTRRIFAPCELISIGITPKGNIPGLSLTNSVIDDESEIQTQTKMNKHLIKLLAALGITLAADATDESAASLVNSACTTATELAALKPAKAKLETDLSLANSNLTTVTAERDALKTEKAALANAKQTAEAGLANAQTAVAAERKERATLLANAAFTEGRLPATERDATIVALCNAADFGAEAAKLAARTKAVSTESKTGNLDKTRGNGPGRAQKVIELVNARMDAKKETYEVAFANVQGSAEYAALYPKT